MTKLIEQVLAIAKEIESLNLGNCGPSDDPDEQYAYSATFRDLLMRFVPLLKRLNDPIIDELLQAVNENFETGFISEAHYQRARITPIMDYINEIKDNNDYLINIDNSSIFVDKSLLENVRSLHSKNYDLSKLVKFIEELNVNYRLGNYLSAILLLRAIINHIPPIFGYKTFSEYVSQSSRSIKSIMQKLEDDARPIADLHTHMTIRKFESVPSKNQIEPYKSSIEILLTEIINKINEDG